MCEDAFHGRERAGTRRERSCVRKVRQSASDRPRVRRRAVDVLARDDVVLVRLGHAAAAWRRLDAVDELEVHAVEACTEVEVEML